jgi:hypothetical protein
MQLLPLSAWTVGVAALRVCTGFGKSRRISRASEDHACVMANNNNNNNNNNNTANTEVLLLARPPCVKNGN